VRTRVAAVLAFVAAAAWEQSARPALASPPPRLVHTTVEAKPLTGTLESFARAWATAQSNPAWLGYEVPATGHQSMCCFDSADQTVREEVGGGCRIEEHRSFSMRDDHERLSSLDDEAAVVLLRADQGHIGRVRVLSRGCAIDAGGRTLTWVDGVQPPESLSLLASLVGGGADEDRHDSLGDAAMMAIAVHGAPEADTVLERFLAPAQAVRVRKQAAFWMGVLRGRRGYEVLSRLVREDPSDDVREHGVFALSQSPVPEAVDAMIRVAREDASTHVRGQALFWLGQKAGARAVSALSRAVEDDTDTEVKKKAVFALSQLPREEGVPLLIQVAKTNRNREVRKQAMFWLGQSGDSRALAFFEEVLAR